MSKLDFKALGFKAGLEIHQQLSGKKLFCNCPAEIREDKPHFTISRILRASTGESGEIDIAASHEQSKMKVFEYQGFQDTTCLKEMDEEPVSKPNHEAVETAVMVSKLFDMNLVDNVHVMRKVVVDGSNTSGFQRTMLISVDGMISDVRVDRLCLEEDSCKIVAREKDKDIYNLSRLGIPLLEITTKPDIKNPQHLQDTARNIGMVLRSTGRVKRGLGTIRQDVNISIKRGSRVEIKGVQALDLIPEMAENEVRRQNALADLADELKELELEWCVECTAGLKDSTGWMKKSLEKGDVAYATIVKGITTLFGRELYPSYRVGTELAGYAKAWGFGGLVHSDEKPEKYGLKSWDSVRKVLGITENDSFILAVGPEKTTVFFINQVLGQRITNLTVGVPSEVRKANDDGTTTYLRPMPGGARMYPETDCKTFLVDKIDVELPELISDKIMRMKKLYGIDESLISELIRTGRDELFERYANKDNARIVSDILVVREKDIKKRKGVDVDINPIADELIYRLISGSISTGAVDDIILEYHNTGSIDWTSYTPINEDDVRKTVRDIVKSDPKAPFGALMGAAMKKLQGKADGKLVSKLLTEELAR